MANKRCYLHSSYPANCPCGKTITTKRAAKKRAKELMEMAEKRLTVNADPEFQRWAREAREIYESL